MVYLSVVLFGRQARADRRSYLNENLDTVFSQIPVKRSY